MTDKQIYKRAAEMIANGKLNVACSAIDLASGSGFIYTRQRYKFEVMFMPENKRSSSTWFDEPTPENQLARSLALLLMAEMEEE